MFICDLGRLLVLLLSDLIRNEVQGKFPELASTVHTCELCWTVFFPQHPLSNFCGGECTDCSGEDFAHCGVGGRVFSLVFLRRFGLCGLLLVPNPKRYALCRASAQALNPNLNPTAERVEPNP